MNLGPSRWGGLRRVRRGGGGAEFLVWQTRTTVLSLRPGGDRVRVDSNLKWHATRTAAADGEAAVRQAARNFRVGD